MGLEEIPPNLPRGEVRVPRASPRNPTRAIGAPRG
jgi:hypothetical protein